MTNLLRKYKLHILGIPVDNKSLKIFEFLNSKLSNLQPFETSIFPDYVFYMNNEIDRIMQLNKKSGILEIKFSDFEMIVNEFNIEEKCLGEIIWAITIYKHISNPPQLSFFGKYTYLESYFGEKITRAYLKHKKLQNILKS